MAEARKNSGPKKKGGVVYPRITLEEAVSFARKLVSKTHVSPQPAATIFPGVFGLKPTSNTAQIRASTLKQYKLMTGKPEAYEATELAKKIAAAPEDELPKLLQEACLSPKIFKSLYDTFHGDTTSIPKIRQQAAALGVHPDQTADCAGLFASSAEYAKLGKATGDNLELVAVGNILQGDVLEAEDDDDDDDDLSTGTNSNGEESEIVQPAKDKTDKLDGTQPPHQTSARSVIQVNVTIDSSLDTEKLEKQLLLLRKFGAI